MKYALASITKSCTNLGNFLIEYNVLNLLQEKGFGKPSFEFDSFIGQSQETIDTINELDCFIIPGCTTIALKDYPGVDSVLDKIKVKVFNIAASLPTGREVGDSDKLKKFFEPIASRDPYTDRYLKSLGLKSIFTGCPTLFTGNETEYKKSGHGILFIFAARKFDEQLEILRKFNIQFPEQIKVLLQSEDQREFCLANQVNFEEYSPENLIENLRSAKLIITGRLHGTLPAIALGTPNFFLQTIDDERFSLLEYLKIEMFKIEDPEIMDKITQKIENPELFTDPQTYKIVEELRTRISDYLELIKSEL